MEEITRFVNLPVYTSAGTFVGSVKNVVLDVTTRKLDGLLVSKTNPGLVAGGADVAIPYRWVRAFDDILLLNYFPGKVELPTPAPEADAEEAPLAAH
ncbi:MAG: PRC-barrel domain-containing protein [Thermoplasmatota archaeon]